MLVTSKGRRIEAGQVKAGDVEVLAFASHDSLHRLGNGFRAANFKSAPDAPLYIFVGASDLSENRFALFGPMLQLKPVGTLEC